MGLDQLDLLWKTVVAAGEWQDYDVTSWVSWRQDNGSESRTTTCLDCKTFGVGEKMSLSV